MGLYGQVAMKIGRPSGYNPEVHPVLYARMKAAGFVDMEVAHAFGISRVTLVSWKKSHPAMCPMDVSIDTPELAEEWARCLRDRELNGDAVRRSYAIRRVRWRNPTKDHAYYVRYYATENGSKHFKDNAKKRDCEMRALGSLDLSAFYRKSEALGWKCQLCGCVLDESTVGIDHIVPVSKGGTNAIENLQPLCHSCNSRKSDKTMAEALEVYYANR